MKLFHNPFSPFVRKVMVCAHELDVVDRVEIDPCTVSPVDPNAAVVAASGLGKIPAMVTDDGATLFDSRVICEYLQSLNPAVTLYPADPGHRWSALRTAALGDGICDTGVGLRYETALRPDQYRWPDWMKAQRERLGRSFQHIEDQCMDDLAAVTIGSISIACALGYMDLRFAGIGWRDDRPRLAAWYDTFAQRPSMVATTPPAA